MTFKNLFLTFKFAARDSGKHELYKQASALSFITILNLIPALAISLSLFKSNGKLEKLLYEKIEPFISENMAPGFGHHLIEYLNKTLNLILQGKLGSWGLVFLVLTVFALFNRIEKTVKELWPVPGRRKIKNKIVLYWFLMTLCPIFLAISLYLSSTLQHFSFLNFKFHLLLRIFPFFVSALLFFSMYRFLPTVKVPLRSAFLGALTCAVGLELLKVGFAHYTRVATSFNAIYGALASIPLFLVWVQLSWTVILFGAQVTSSHQYLMVTIHESKRNFPQSTPYVALQILKKLKETNGLKTEELAVHIKENMESTSKALEWLDFLNLIQIKSEESVPLIYLNNTTLKEISIENLKERIAFGPGFN